MNHSKKLTLEQVKKIPTNLLARLANEQGNCKNERDLSDEDLSLFCDDEQYAPNHNDYDYGNNYHRSEWDEWEF